MFSPNDHKWHQKKASQKFISCKRDVKSCILFIFFKIPSIFKLFHFLKNIFLDLQLKNKLNSQQQTEKWRRLAPWLLFHYLLTDTISVGILWIHYGTVSRNKCMLCLQRRLIDIITNWAKSSWLSSTINSYRKFSCEMFSAKIAQHCLYWLQGDQSTFKNKLSCFFHRIYIVFF